MTTPMPDDDSLPDPTPADFFGTEADMTAEPAPAFGPDHIARLKAVPGPDPNPWWKDLIIRDATGEIDLNATLERIPQFESTAAQEIINRYPDKFIVVAPSGEEQPDKAKPIRIWQGKGWSTDLGRQEYSATAHLLWEQMKSAIDNVVAEMVNDEVKKSPDMSEEEIQKLRANLTKLFGNHLAFWKKFGNNNCRKGVRAQFEGMSKVIRVREDFDLAPEILVCENGVLDLQMTETTHRERGRWELVLLEHSPERLVTQSVNALYDPEASAVRFEKYLGDVLPDDEVRWYLQKLLGSALLGKPTGKVFIVLSGPTNSGKSVLLRLLLGVLGDYCRLTKAETFLMPKNGKAADAASPALDALWRAKVVVSSEPDPSQPFDSGLMKSVTGGDQQQTRPLFGSWAWWYPRFVYLLATNTFPKFSATETALMQRIIDIHFPNQYFEPEGDQTWDDIPEDQRADTNLSADILASGVERSGILNWLLEGLRGFLDEGLKVPQVLVDRRSERRDEMSASTSLVAELLDEGFLITGRDLDVVEHSKRLTVGDLHAVLRMAARRDGDKLGKSVVSPKRMSAEVAASYSRGGVTDKQRRGMTFTELAWADWEQVDISSSGPYVPMAVMAYFPVDEEDSGGSGDVR